MGRHNGSWSPIYGQVWTHPKTARAAAWLVSSGRRISASVAPFLVIGWLNRLCLWCLANSEHGSLAGLSEARVATIAWPEAIEDGVAAPKAGATVLGALRAGGFVEGDAPSVHDFQEHHARILKERRRKRTDHDNEDGIGAEGSAEQSAEGGAERRAEGTASTGSGSGSGTGSGTGSGSGSGSGRAAAAALVAEVRSRIRWHGTDDPILTALDDFAAAGMTPEAIRAAIEQHATVGVRPLTLRDAVLDARRKAPKRAARPPSEPCIDCRKAPCLPGRALCAACATPARERAATPAEPAAAAPEAPERGYAAPPHVLGCSPLRPSWRAVCRPGPRRRWHLDDED